MPEGGRTPRHGRAEAEERLEYPESPGAEFVPVWTGWETAPDAAQAGGARTHGGGAARCAAPASAAEWERLLHEDTRRAFEAGRGRGIEEGRKLEREAGAAVQAAAAKERVRRAAAMVEEFGAERERYFRAVEAEVVKLALAVAARILRREAGGDPLLLMGAVRAALGQISAATGTRVLVPEAELNLWSEAMALLPNLSEKPRVEAGKGMVLGDCRIESSLGFADLGLQAQLAEIEEALLEKTGGAEARKPRREAEAGADAERVG